MLVNVAYVELHALMNLNHTWVGNTEPFQDLRISIPPATFYPVELVVFFVFMTVSRVRVNANGQKAEIEKETKNCNQKSQREHLLLKGEARFVQQTDPTNICETGQK
jgi:hypothetical protein